MNVSAADPSAKVRTPGDVVFSAAMHLRLLLRVDRTQSIRRVLQSAIRPGARVLDAGCGSGLLSFLALDAGASEVVAVDRDNIDLARALAHENDLEKKITFVEADLNTLRLPGAEEKKFDALLAFIYSNHISVDEARSRTVCGLRRRFGLPSCITVPNKVRYWAIACEWPEADSFTELADLRAAVTEIEGRYSLKLQSLADAASAEVLFTRSRPDIYGDYKWIPGGANGGYRHDRGNLRFLSERTAVCEISYDAGVPFERLPERITLRVCSPGTLTAVLWVQELWFEDFLIWSAEAMSPVAKSIAARSGDRLEAALDSRWRATNIVPVTAIDSVRA